MLVFRHTPVVRFGSYSSLPELYSAVDSSVYQGGARRMDRVLEAASAMLSSRKPDSRKTVVLLTGGRNSQEAGPNSLGRSVQRLREMGAKVIVMAVGSLYDVQELLPIVRQQQDIHPVPGANDLVPYVNLIATYITLGPSGKDNSWISSFLSPSSPSPLPLPVFFCSPHDTRSFVLVLYKFLGN